MEKKDIETREDLLSLLHAFYEKAINDTVIGHFFTKVVHLDLEKHIPVIADFWETILLNGDKYTKNAILPHVHISQRSPMEEKHFARWLDLFFGTIDALFEGPVAESAKKKAGSIANIMRIKVAHSINRVK